MDSNPARRNRLVLLGILGGLLALTVVYQFWPKSEPARTTAPRVARQGAGNARPAARRGQPAAVDTGDVVDVEVSRLEHPAPEIERTGRNPFRFQAQAAPAPTTRPEPPPPTPGAGEPGDPPAPSGPPPPPPITLKFIGTLSGGGPTGKVAILSDGKFVYYGREGDIIEGRYRVVKIGEESVQMEHVDGRGRQTIRLSGA